MVAASRDGSKTIFSRAGDGPRLRLPSTNVEPNPDISCLAGGQNLHRSDTRIACLKPACGNQALKQTHQGYRLPFNPPTATTVVAPIDRTVHKKVFITNTSFI